MTIVVALKCKDGIVVGSDSQTTMTTEGGSIRNSIQKIHKIGENTIFTGAGTLGLLNKSRTIVAKYATDLDKGLAQDTLDKIKQELCPILRTAKECYVEYERKTEGVPNVDIAIIGIDTKKIPRIWHMSPDTHDDYMDEVGMWVGGSANIAGYVLLRSYVNLPYGYQEDNPTLKEGLLIVYRTITEAINTMANGIGGALQIWALVEDKGTGKYYVHEIDRPRKGSDGEEMNELSKRYMEWKKSEKEFLSKTI